MNVKMSVKIGNPTKLAETNLNFTKIKTEQHVH